MKYIKLVETDSEVTTDNESEVVFFSEESQKLTYDDANIIIYYYNEDEDEEAVQKFYTANTIDYDTVLEYRTGDSAHSDSDITKVVFNEGVTSIGNKAFINCGGISKVTLPSTITELGESSFEGCTNMASINIPDGVTKIGSAALARTGIVSLYVPASVQSMSSLNTCVSLKTVEFEEGVKFDKDIMITMNNCYSIEEVDVPNGVIGIPGSCFINCKKLTNVYLPDTITTISGFAFSNCSILTGITIYATEVPAIGANTFKGLPDGFKIYVPSDSVESYKSSKSYWSGYTSNIEAIIE